MRGWERIGRVGPDRTIWLEQHATVDGSDIIAFAAPTGALRCGTVRARDVLDRWLPYTISVPSLGDGDHVLKAVALDQHSFGPSTPPPTD